MPGGTCVCGHEKAGPRMCLTPAALAALPAFPISSSLWRPLILLFPRDLPGSPGQSAPVPGSLQAPLNDLAVVIPRTG